VIVAVVLVTAYVWVEESRSAGNMVTPAAAARVAAVFSLVVALELLIGCVPLWLLLARIRWANSLTAALLGFAAPLLWVVVNEGAMASGVREGLPFALCGAMAGLVVWWSRPKRAAGP
jgi:hypothetical protein